MIAEVRPIADVLCINRCTVERENTADQQKL